MCSVEQMSDVKMFDQFYHTRCRAEESVIGQEEFTIRASSLSPEQIRSRQLQAPLADLAAYELPLTMRAQARNADGLAVEHAPFRLARLRLPDGNLGVVHSVYRADAGARTMNYFSHILLPCPGSAALTARECVSLWGLQASWGAASVWVWRGSRGMDLYRSKVLPVWMPPERTTDRILSVEAVRAFLRGETTSECCRCKSLGILPERLRGDENAETRRLLIESVLSAFLNKQRVFLLAEPGLTALLVYSVTVLLPSAITESLTFSTYESPTRFDSCRADVVGTVADPGILNRPNLASREGTVLIDTHKPVELPVRNTNVLVSSYVSDSVSRLLHGQDLNLAADWNIIERVVDGNKVDIPTFLAAWGKCRRLAENATNPLSESDLIAYLTDSEWRRLLFEQAVGRTQAVDLAVSRRFAVETWWPASGNDTEKLASFRPFLSHFRELLLGRIVDEMRCHENPQEHLDIANYCLGTLLWALTDDEFSKRRSLEMIIDRLEQVASGSSLAHSLPFETRITILKLARQSTHLSSRAPAWLHVANVEELQRMCAVAELRVDWHALALATWVEENNGCDVTTAELVLEDRRRLQEFVSLIGDTPTAGGIWDSLWTALPTTTKRVKLCCMVLKTGVCRHNKQLRLSFRRVIDQLVDENCSWPDFFTGSHGLDALVDVIGVQTDTSTAFWLACCRSLDASCLDVGSASHTVLLGLFRVHDEGKLFWPTNGTHWSQVLDHWRRVYAALHLRLPVGEQWYAFRWSLKALEIQSPGVLGRLLRRVVTNGQVKEPSEIVDSAKTLLPKGAGVVELASALVAATQSLPDEMKSQIQFVLLSEACQETCEHYEQILSNKTHLGLSADVEASLLEKRIALLQRNRDAQLDASIRTRFRDCVACFGLPVGLIAAALLVFVCLGLWSQRSIFGPAGFAALCLFVVGGLTIAFYQSWAIYKIRTGRMDSFDVRNKPRTSKRQRSRRSSPPVAGPSVNGSDDARQPSDSARP